jgi:lincosamide and streptogramin A transport system ATP-binding/permease protein
MAKISVTNLTFGYDGSETNVFEDVSFTLDTDWKTGLVGRNGRGKTTLLRLFADGSHAAFYYEYRGTITSPVSFDYFPYDTGDGSMTARELIASTAPEAQDWQTDRELTLLDVVKEAADRPLSTLSGGERTKVMLAALFLRSGNFLLIDEPTDHLDAEGRESVARYLSQKSGFILVSHDRRTLDRSTDHTMSINRSDIEIIRGSYGVWKENRDRRDSFEADENVRLRRDIDRLTEAAARASGWSNKLEATKLGTRNAGLRPDRGYIGHKSAKMMKRVKSIENRAQRSIDEKVQLFKNIEQADTLKLKNTPYYKKRCVELYNLSIRYKDGRELFSGLSLTVENGERISLRGPNGCGKSSVLKLICGEQIPYTGRFIVGSGLVISYVPQETGFLRGSLSDYAASCGVDESLYFAILRKLDFTRMQFDIPLEECSAGQKKKVLLARSLSEAANLYVWDEPLNFIDILSREQIEELILKFEPTLIFVEHDASFSEKVATKTAVLG